MDVETYMGVPVILRRERSRWASYHNGVITLDPSLKGEEKERTLQHEYLHHLFYSKYSWLDTELPLTLLSLSPLLAYFAGWPVALLLSLPQVACLAHEVSVSYRMKEKLACYKQVVAGLAVVGCVWASCVLVNL